VPPRLVESGAVPYPEGATGSAVVTLTLVVNRDGTVRSAEVARGDEPFASVAAAAARRFRFEPATRAGQTVAATIHFEVEFVAPATNPDVSAPNGSAPTSNGSAPAPNGSAPAPSGSAPAPNGSAPTPNGSANPGLTEVIVYGERPAPAVTSLGRAEVRQLPGAFGDPFRALEAMPGVTPIISGLPYFYLRGAPPGNIGYYLDGVRVPYLFHVGLGPSIVNPAMVDRVDLYPGGYPARFGRFTGGIVSGETTAPRTDFHGEGNLRVFDVGGIMETGFAGGRGTVLIGGRYSYTATALSLINKNAELDYRDYQLRVSYDFTPHDRITTFGFGSYDLLGQKQPQGLRVLFGTEFYRLDTRYDHFYGKDNRVRFAITLGYDQTRLDVERNAQDKMLAGRIELSHHLSSHALLRAGMDGTLDKYSADHASYVDPDAPDVIAFDSLFPPRNDYAFGVYTDVVWDVTPGLEVTPGLRADLFQSQGTTKPSVDARLAGKVRVAPRVKLIEAFGLAHQPPAFVVPVPGLTPATLANGLQTSFQTSAGVELALPASITATTTLFHNAFFNMSDDLGTNQAPDLNNLDQRSLGNAYGLELYVHRSLTTKLGGFLTYTLSRSTRSLGTEHFLSAFDRTHVLNFALAYDLGKNWRAGARFMFYTGIPKRPDIPPGLIQPPRTTSVEREPSFYRIDWRVEKRWNLKGTGWISLVFEMLNATFHKETVGNTEIGPVTIPSIGVEAGF
jgi:TonB family protein